MLLKDIPECKFCGSYFSREDARTFFEEHFHKALDDEDICPICAVAGYDKVTGEHREPYYCHSRGSVRSNVERH